MYSFGRSPRCDVQITEEKLRHRLNLSVVSQQQFSISRQENAAVLTDLSSNGTFVNTQAVGKGRTQLLHHGDTISIISSKCQSESVISHTTNVYLMVNAFCGFLLMH